MEVITVFPPRAKAITPHNTNPLTDHDGRTQAMYVFVGVAGDVSVVPSGNPVAASPVVFTCQAGSYVPVMVAVVRSTGTTASGIVGVW